MTNKLKTNPDLSKNFIIVIDSNNIIIDGNHKLMAAYLSGIDTINCVNIDE
jgi:wobble nucleotide-excising tRNase